LGAVVLGCWISWGDWVVLGEELGFGFKRQVMIKSIHLKKVATYSDEGIAIDELKNESQ
jgi:hypothetical protein